MRKLFIVFEGNIKYEFLLRRKIKNLYIDLVSYGCFVFEDIGLGLDFLLD